MSMLSWLWVESICKKDRFKIFFVNSLFPFMNIQFAYVKYFLNSIRVLQPGNNSHEKCQHLSLLKC